MKISELENADREALVQELKALKAREKKLKEYNLRSVRPVVPVVMQRSDLCTWCKRDYFRKDRNEELRCYRCGESALSTNNESRLPYNVNSFAIKQIEQHNLLMNCLTTCVNYMFFNKLI